MRRAFPTERGRAALAAGITLAGAGLFLGFRELTRIGLLTVALVGLALIWTRWSTPRLDVETSVIPESPQVGGWVAAGEPITLRLHVRSLRARRLILRLQQPLPRHWSDQSPTWKVAPQKAEGTLDLDYTFTPQRRGRYVLPRPVASWTDSFGVTGRRLTVPGEPRVVTVLPRLHDLESRTLGRALAPALGRVSEGELGAVRPYAVGDDLRHVHWSASAHRGELMTRHDEPSRARGAVLMLTPHLQGSVDPDSFEWGIEFVASAAVTLRSADVPVELLTWTPNAASGTPTLTSVTGDEDILLALALMPGSSPREDREHVPGLTDASTAPLAAAGEATTRAGLVVLVSDRLPPPTLLPPPSAPALGAVVLLSHGALPDRRPPTGATGWHCAQVSDRQTPAEVWEHLLAASRP